MASAPVLPLVPVEQYLKTDYEPHCEYLDGELLPKSLPDYIHSKLQKLLIVLLAQHAVEGLAELHTRISPRRYRIPDVCGLVQPPADGRYPDRDTPPLFTIEIASRDEPWFVLRGKVADHLAIGVEMVIIANPYDHTVMVATQTEPVHEIAPPLVVRIAVPNAADLLIDFDELFRQL